MSRAVAGVQQESADVQARALAASRRLWEVDMWRGIAITAMVIFHLVYNLRVFVGMDINLFSGFWFYFQRFTATSFILLVGISLALSYNRALQRQDGTKELYWKFLRRGLKIIGVAMAITVVMRVGMGRRLDYGVLHFIGTAVVIAYPFLHLRWLNVAIAALLFALSYPIHRVTVDTYAFVWLGLEPAGYAPADYFPLIHWFSVVLIGIFVGNMLYTNGERQFTLPDLSAFFPFNVLQLLGRHSLLIYVIHQPILVVLLIAFGLISLGL